MRLNPNNVPSSLRRLLPIAEDWGIGDDFKREAMLESASSIKLKELISSIDDVSDEELFGWLAGSESLDPKPSPEYLAITALTMAIDSAKIKLRKRANGDQKTI